MKNNLISAKITSDGSSTLYNEQLQEHYHSMHGAVQESKHVFIKSGLLKVAETKKHISILEIGFGTGLNFLLTYNEAVKNSLTVDYMALEKNPIGDLEIAQLNYSAYEKEKGFFNRIHELNWSKKHELENCLLVKHQSDALTFPLQGNTFDVIYFDAFSPEIQPELWELSFFKKLYVSLRADGVLVTYCAKGVVKRNLKLAGFAIEPLSGPPGKREITRAKKLRSNLD